MHHIYCVLCTVLLALAIDGPDAAADGADAPTARPAQLNVLRPSLKPLESRDVWVNPDALDVNLYGLTYHPDRARARHLNLDNEFNPGLGLHYEYHSNQQGVAFGESGAYRDSGKNWATLHRWAISSSSENDGEPVRLWPSPAARPTTAALPSLP